MPEDNLKPSEDVADSGQQQAAPAPQPIAAPAQTASASPGTPKKKKGLIIGIVIAALLLVAFGGGAAAYAFWYQAPDKVVRDGFANLTSVVDANIKSKLDVKSKEVSMTLNAATLTNDNGQTATSASVKLAVNTGEVSLDADIKGQIVTESKDDELTVYFKAENIKDTVHSIFEDQFDGYMESYQSFYSPSELQKMRDESLKEVYQSVDPILDEVDGKWLKFTSEKSEDEDDTMTCYVETIRKMQNDPSARKEVAEAYKQHPFIAVKEKLGSKDGSLGYLLEYNDEESRKFGEAVESTEVAKHFKDCDPDAASSTKSDTASDDGSNIERFEVWVSRWSHKITSVQIDAKIDEGSTMAATSRDQMDMSLRLEFDYSKPEEIKIPEGAADVKDLQKKLEDSSGGISPLLML